MLTDSSRESAFLMPEEFAVDGAFWNTATVDGKVLAHTAAAVVMNEAGDDLLADTALTRNQN